jgi:arylformamidase
MSVAAGRLVVPEVDFDRAASLALPLDFSQPHPRHFGAPLATSEAFTVGDFEGDVTRGASCNCRRVVLIPHCNGTHTESVSHLTIEQRPLHEIIPAGPMAALLLTVGTTLHDGAEDSAPAPQAGDHLITRAALLDAWRPFESQRPPALLLRTGTDWRDTAPPFLSQQCARELVARGVMHLVIDLPSVDRLADEGKLTAHRIFFGLPPGSTRLDEAARGGATITELATFPVSLQDGPCAAQIQIPAWSGDAVPSRPLYLPLRVGRT